MKTNKLLICLSLLSAISLAGCQSGNQPSGNDPAPSVTPTPSVNPNPDIKDIKPDPYASVLEGLDKSKDRFSDAYRTNRTYLGGYSETVSGVKVSYGWIQYTQKWTADSSSTYGVAVKLTITAEGKIKEIKLGAPEKDVHNFTPYYGRTSGYDIYNDYIVNYEKNLNAAFANKSVRSVFKSLGDAVCDPKEEPTEEDSGTYATSKNDPTVVAGATQTAARTERAIYAAAAAYLNENNPNAHVFAHVSNNLKAGDIPGNNQVTNGHRKTTDGSYGFVRYNQYYSYYGAAVKIKVKANNVIDHVYLGTPRKGAHNFTPWYSLTSQDQFVNFFQNAEELINNKLAGKVVNEALVNHYKAAVIPPLSNQEGHKFESSESLIGSGATQTDTRIDLALAAAREGILSDEEAKPDEGGIVDEALEGANVASGSAIYASFNHRKSDYVTPEEDTNGYYNAATHTAYGWRRYENPWAKGNYYGAAVSLTFDADNGGKITDVKVGVPVAGDVNRTTIYRAHYDSDPIYVDNYAQYLVQDRKAARVGKSAADVYQTTDSASVGKDKDGNLLFVPGDYDFLGAGATQTTSRINVALFEAASAYRIASDPFTKNVFADLELTKDTDIKDDTFHVGGKKGEGFAYGYTIYYISAWGSYYGAAIKLNYGSDRKITSVETGEPKVVDAAKPWASATNFTSSYTFNSIESRTAYHKYYTGVKEAVNKALAGKTINEALGQEFASAKVEFDPKDNENNKYTPVEAYRFVGAGATQTDTRIAAAIYGAIQAALK